MSAPVNLNRYRKEKARAERRAQADANAVKFGRSKIRKIIDKDAIERARQQIDQHRREPE